MGGGKIPAKDVSATDRFVASLESIYYLALDTGRANQFDSKALYESILANKLPQFRHKWIIKWSDTEVTDSPSLVFTDF